MPRSALRMPKMSMTMETGEVASWHIGVGDRVTEGQIVCDVETDKVTMEVEATAAGTVVGIEATEGATVPVGEPLAWIETESESLMDDLFDVEPDAEPDAEPQANAARATVLESDPVGEPDVVAPPPVEETAPGIVPAIPRARRLAAEHDVALPSVTGTGPGGAVLVSDVQSVVSARAAADARPAARAEKQPTTTADRPPAAAAEQPPAAATDWPTAAPGEWPPATTGERLPVATGDRLPEVTGSAWASSGASAEAVVAPVPWGAAAAVTAPASVTVAREVLLGPAAPAEDHDSVLARLVAGLARALVTLVPEAAGNVGLVVDSPAGPVTLTIPQAHALAPSALVDLVAQARAQALQGRVDVRYLRPAEVTLTLLTDVDEAVLPCPPGVLLAVAAGAPEPRVVAIGEAIGVRTTTRLTATADVRWGAGRLARALAITAATVATQA